MGVYEVFIGILAYLLHKIITAPMLYHPVTSCNIRQGSKNSFMIISMLLVKLPVRILATSVVVAYKGSIQCTSRRGNQNQDWCGQNYLHLVLDYPRVDLGKITKTIFILWQSPEWSCHIMSSDLAWFFHPSQSIVNVAVPMSLAIDGGMNQQRHALSQWEWLQSSPSPSTVVTRGPCPVLPEPWD